METQQQQMTIEIPLIGQGDWSAIDYQSIVDARYGITTPDGKLLNEQQVCAVLLMEAWYFNRHDFFSTPIGEHLLKPIARKIHFNSLAVENEAIGVIADGCRLDGILEGEFQPTEDEARSLKNELLIGLNQWFQSDFSLIGWAGTGKTASLQAFLHRVKQRAHILITVMAPTNKALKVIKAFGKNSNITGVEYQTLYQGLGMKLEVNDDGKEEAVGDKDGKQNLQEFDLAVCDEDSFVNEAIYFRVTGLNNRPRFIWMGDSKQLKPIGDKTISPVFTNVLASYTLSKVMRYPEGSAIASLVTAVRDNVGSSEWIDPREYANGEDVIVTDSEDFLVSLIEDLESDKYQENPDYVKAIAYQNTVVDWINDYCHTHLFGKKADAFVAGERLVSTKPVTRRRLGVNEVILKNRFEVDCLRSVEDTEEWDNTKSLQIFNDYVVPNFPNGITDPTKAKPWKPAPVVPLIDIFKVLERASMPLTFWRITASVVDEDRRVNLNLIDPSERATAAKIIDTLRLIALAIPKGSKERKTAWFGMYEFMRMFDPVVHSYSITCHSAQGSSYNHVYIAEKDLMRCKDPLERSQLKYVAYSRAMERLIISV